MISFRTALRLDSIIVWHWMEQELLPNAMKLSVLLSAHRLSATKPSYVRIGHRYGEREEKKAENNMNKPKSKRLIEMFVLSPLCSSPRQLLCDTLASPSQLSQLNDCLNV